MFIPTNLINVSVYAKIIALRAACGDFWNSFLAGVTKAPDLPEDPLAHLDLRGGPRAATVTETFGMVDVEGSPGIYRWEQRRLIPNPNPDEVALGRTVVHERPRYSPETKGPYSKHQSTTLVNVGRNIRPKLFEAFTEIGLQCGVIFPANPNYALANRMIKYDAGTYGRPYDTGSGRPLGVERTYESFESIYTDPDMQGPSAQFTEILSRLRWYNSTVPLSMDASEAGGMIQVQPAILICVSDDRKKFLDAIVLSLRRAFDIKLALFRKFRIVQQIPIVLYNHNAQNPENVLNGYFILRDNQRLEEFIFEILHHSFPNRSNIAFDEASIKIIRLQHGLDKLLRGLRPPANFDDLLKGPFRFSDLYLETWRALIACTSSGGGMPVLININNPIYDRSYAREIERYTSGTAAEQEYQFFLYGFRADFRHLANAEQYKKIQGTAARFLPQFVQHQIQLGILMNLNRTDDACLLLRGTDLRDTVHAQGPILGYTLLMMAAERNNERVARILLEIPGVKFESRDFLGVSPFIYAILNNSVDVLRLFLNRPNIKINEEFDYELHFTMLEWQSGIGFKTTYEVPVTPLTPIMISHHSSLKRLLLYKRDAHIPLTPREKKHLDWYWRYHRSYQGWLGESYSHHVNIFTNRKNAHLCTYNMNNDVQCMRCLRKFSALHVFNVVPWGRVRHHCRGCGEPVCGDCSSMTRVHWDNNQSIRICNECKPIVERHEPLFRHQVD